MKILFVDDEVKILEGLERSLLMVADEDWDLEFVDSGPRALARLADDAFDVIVTDMRMPGMDGAEVLQRAREIAPSTARIVLSGQMEASSALSAVERAHQILSKPCAAEQLCDILRSAVRFRRLLDGDVFRRAVVSADRLPAAPHIYREIRAELDRGDPAIARVAVIAAKDPALTARLVHVANSPFFGGGRRITGAIEAIQRLGLPVLEALAVAAAFEHADGSSRELDVVALQARALRVAELAARLRASEAGMAYLARCTHGRRPPRGRVGGA
ncbi:MAG: response regulator [Deltaproteobacteria bacterium]|nr:response regulator [Deltaproteobacteria bacterium]